jgi:CheY-like chemotaxis protein
MTTRKNILFVDDDKTTRKILKTILDDHGYESFSAENGDDALHEFKLHDIDIVITDIEMPEMDGFQLIQEIKKLDDDVLCMVLSVHNEPELVIKIMKLGIYDYLIKPVKADVLELTLKRAFETIQLRRMKKAVENEKHTRLLNQIEWLNFTDNLLKKDEHGFDKLMLESLYNTFTQGAGIGTILTLLKMISETAVKEDDHYLVPEDLFNIIQSNVNIADNAILAFSKIIKIINEEIETEKIKLSILYNKTSSLLAEMKKYTAVRNNTIVISDPEDLELNAQVDINLEFCITIVKELLINAMKFSPEGSTIMLLLKNDKRTLNISVVNTPLELSNGVVGIPEEYRTIIFEPFYRISKQIHIDYDCLNFGLGLTQVEIIMQKHNGKVEASTIKDLRLNQSKSSSKVVMSVEFPLV